MTFTEWLQSRLVAHGFKIEIDGIIGPNTRRAMKQFQAENNLRPIGVANKATVAALRADVDVDEVVEKPPTEALPPWMEEMARRMGLHEREDNTPLSLWLRAGRFLGNPAKLPWCGDAVETCIIKTIDEAVPSNPFWAQAWKNFGRACNGPIVGSIGVIRWSARAGHVGFVADSNKSKVLLLGGNQSNEINLTWFPRSKFIAYRWPKNYPVKKYPPFTGAAKQGSLGGTR